MNNDNNTKRVRQSAAASQAKACHYEEPEALPTITPEEARAERIAESLRERARYDRLREQAWDRAQNERRARWA